MFRPSKKTTRTLALVLIIIALMVWEAIGIYYFLSKKYKTCEAERGIASSPTTALGPLAPNFQIVGGAVMSFDGSNLALERGGMFGTYSIDQNAQVFEFRETEEYVPLVSFFAEDFSSKPGVSKSSLDQVKEGQLAFVILEVLDESSYTYMGRKVVIIKAD